MADIPMPNSILPLRQAYEDAVSRRDTMDRAESRLRRLSAKPAEKSGPAVRKKEGLYEDLWDAIKDMIDEM